MVVLLLATMLLPPIALLWLLNDAATAAGMMLAASLSLFYEGLVLESDHPCSVPQSVRVTLGLVGGLVFITSTKQILDRYEDIKVAGLDGASVVQCLNGSRAGRA